MQAEKSVIILAAGHSSRMGKQKFSLKLADGRTFLEHIVDQYFSFGCRTIILVLNEEGRRQFETISFKGKANIICVTNKYPERERYYSIKLGLSLIKNGSHVFVHNADNPFASHSILEELSIHQSEADYIKPVYKGKGGHPILISPLIVKDIIRNKNYNFRFNDFLKKYSLTEISTDDDKILTNINTILDYSKL